MTSRTRISCFLVGIAVALAGPITDSARGDLVAETGFNDETGINSNGSVDGVPYLDGAEPDAVGQGMGESGWTSAWYRPNATTGSAVTDSNVTFEGDLSLHSTLDSSHSVWARSFTPQTSGIVKSSARVYFDDLGTQAFTFYLDGEGDTQYGSVVSIDDDGSLDIIGGNGHGATAVDSDVLSAGSIGENSWVLFETEADMTTQTFTVSINGSSVPGSWYFRFTKILDGDPIDNLDTFRFQNSLSQVSFVDDIHITHEDAFSGLVVTRRLGETTGNVTLTNIGDPVDILGYKITSAAGALDQTGWIPITGNYDVDGNGSVDSNDSWTILTGSGVHTDLSESQLLPGDGGTLANGAMIDLGNVWLQNQLEDEDVEFEILLADGNVTTLPVVFEGGTGSAFVRSDLNFDGNITEADFAIYAAGLFTTLPTDSAALRYQAGDLDGDGDNDVDDFAIFKEDYIAANSATAFEALLASVPEPSSVAVLLIGAVTLLGGPRRRASRTLALVLAACFSLAMTHSARAYDIVAQTGFNDVSGINANGTPDSPYEMNATLDAAGQGDGEPGWTTSWVNEYPGSVGTSSIQGSTFNEGDLALSMTSTGSGGTERAVYYREFTRQSIGVASLSVDINIDDLGSTGPTLIYMEDDDNHSQDQSGVILITTAGLIEAYDGAPGTRVSTGVTLSEDTWYTIQFDANYNTRTYRVAVNGTDTGMAYGFRNVESEGFGRVTLWQQTDGTSYYDALSVLATPLEELEQLQVTVLTDAGKMQLTNRFDESYSWDYYKLTSAGNSLDADEWSSLDDQGYDGDGWLEAGGSQSDLLSEVSLGTSTLDPGETVALGAGYDETVDAQDLQFEYRDATSDRVFKAYVLYSRLGDMDADGDLDEFDVPLFIQALTNRSAYDAAYPGVNADFVGDFDGNGLLDAGDIAAFSDAVANAATASSTAVPEPTSALLFTLAACCLVYPAHRHGRLASN